MVGQFVAVVYKRFHMATSIVMISGSDILGYRSPSFRRGLSLPAYEAGTPTNGIVHLFVYIYRSPICIYLSLAYCIYLDNHLYNFGVYNTW